MAVFAECSGEGRPRGSIRYQHHSSFWAPFCLPASDSEWGRRGSGAVGGNLLLVCCYYYSPPAASRPHGQEVRGMECVHGWRELRRETHTAPSFSTLESATGKWWWMCLLRWVHGCVLLAGYPPYPTPCLFWLLLLGKQRELCCEWFGGLALATTVKLTCPHTFLFPSQPFCFSKDCRT